MRGLAVVVLLLALWAAGAGAAGLSRSFVRPAVARQWRLAASAVGEVAGEEETGLQTAIPTPPPEQQDDRVGGVRAEDLEQERDLDLILTERSRRFYDPKLRGVQREACLLVAVETKQEERTLANAPASSDLHHQFTFQESLSELSELVGTAGLEVYGVVVQKLATPNLRTYVGPGKIGDIMQLVNETNARTIVVDDDLTPKQQLSMEAAFAQWGGADVKILDRTALILEIFAQHARTREGQLQVELAQLQYRLTRGPSARGDPSSSDIGGKNSGAGFRGPGETKLETDRRMIRDRIVLLKRELLSLDARREQHRTGRARLGLPVVALVGYTNAGKSSLLNVLSRAGVLAENMLFATLDNTIRKVRLDRGVWDKNKPAQAGAAAGAQPGPGSGSGSGAEAEAEAEAALDLGSGPDAASAPIIDSSPGTKKGQEILVTDTVGFISKLPTDLVAAFRATLDEVRHADVLVHVCDRSSPVWEKQRETVLRELDALGVEAPVVELWNKVDAMASPEDVRLEAVCLPVDVEATVLEEDEGEGEGDGEEAGGVEGGVLPAAAQSSAAQSEEAEEDDEEEDDEEGYLTDAAYSDHLAALAPAYGDGSDPDSETAAAAAAAAATVAALAPLPSTRPLAPSAARRRALRSARKTFTVAASVKTGLGFDDFVSTLVDALSLRLREVEVFVPYNKDDGIIAAIHTQGVVLELAYGEMGTRLRCRVPPALLARLSERGLRTRPGGGQAQAQGQGQGEV